MRERGRRARAAPYGLKGWFEPLIPRERRFEVAERCDAEGAVLIPLDEDAVRQAARKPFMKRFMERNADKSLRWCGTLYPTQASAQDAEMSLRAYEDFVFKAGLLHLDDPAAAWREIETRQQLVVDYLNTTKEVHFQVPPHNGEKDGYRGGRHQ